MELVPSEQFRSVDSVVIAVEWLPIATTHSQRGGQSFTANYPVVSEMGC